MIKREGQGQEFQKKKKICRYTPFKREGAITIEVLMQHVPSIQQIVLPKDALPVQLFLY